VPNTSIIMLGPSLQPVVAEAAELSFRDIPEKTDSESVPDCKLDEQELEGKASAISDVRVAVSLPSGRVVARYGMQGTDVVASLKTKLRESFGYGIAQQRLMTDMAIVENHWALKDCMVTPSRHLSLTLFLREWCVNEEFEELAVFPSQRPNLIENVREALRICGPRSWAPTRIYRYPSEECPAFNSIGEEIRAHAGMHGFTKKCVINSGERTWSEKEKQADAWIDKTLKKLHPPDLTQSTVMWEVLKLITEQKPKGCRDAGGQRAAEWRLMDMQACFAAWKVQSQEAQLQRKKEVQLQAEQEKRKREAQLQAEQESSNCKKEAQWQAVQAALEAQKGLWNLCDLQDTCKCQAAGIPADVREQFLQQEQFRGNFQMCLEDFNELPMWKRRAMKKKLGLF